MDEFFKPDEKKSGISRCSSSPGSWRRDHRDRAFRTVVQAANGGADANLLAGAVKAGDPTFDAVNKDILIATDHDNTVESPTGLGTISMYIKEMSATKETATSPRSR